MKPVSGYQNFMKNAKANLRFVIKLIYIFCFLFAPLNLHAAHMFKIRTKTPSSMNTSDGFFNPTIRVCRGDYTHCDDMADGECEGVGMTYARAYTDFEGEEPKMCACQVFTCYDALAKGLISMSSLLVGGIAVLATLDKDYSKECIADQQCIPIPLAPGPPPFCDQFESSPEIRIVPVEAREQSFFQPKIRVIIGSSKTNLDVNADGSERSHTINLNKERYTFKTYKEEDKLCADFLGGLKGEKFMLGSQCFPMLKVGKPELIPLDGEGNKIKKLDDMTIVGPKKSIDLNKVEVPGYSHNPITLIYGEERDVGGLRLKLIKPKVDSNRNFELRCSGGGKPFLACVNKEGGLRQVDAVCSDEEIGPTLACPENQSLGYAENNNGKVTCLVGWDSDEYVLRRKENKKIFKYLKSSGKQFNDYRVVPIANKDQYIPCSTSRKDLNIMGQDDLDNIKRFSGSYYSIGNSNPICNDSSICCRGCLCHEGDKLRVVKKGESCNNGKCNASYKIVYKYEDIVHKSGSFDNEPSNPEYSTRYIDKNTEKPFFLTKEELNDKKGEFFRPKDPYIDGLCVDNFERISYIDPKKNFNSDSKKDSNSEKSLSSDSEENSNPDLRKDHNQKDQHHYFNAKEKQCQFVTMEAWGGGAAGFIDEGNLIKSTSGPAGDYTKATIKVNDEKPIFKIKVGSGGELEQNSGNGNASEVYMCDKDRKNCDKLIIAGGGGNSIREQNEAIINENLLYTGFVGRVKGTHEPDKIALPYGNRKDEIPYDQAVYKKTSFCNGAIKSNQVKKVVNDNSVPGSGGCISVDKLSYQEGANGKVTITCEQWD